MENEEERCPAVETVLEDNAANTISTADLIFNPHFPEGDGPGAEANDNFDPLELPQDIPEDRYFLSLDQMAKLEKSLAGNYPMATDYKDVHPNEMMDVNFNT